MADCLLPVAVRLHACLHVYRPFAFATHTHHTLIITSHYNTLLRITSARIGSNRSTAPRTAHQQRNQNHDCAPFVLGADDVTMKTTIRTSRTLLAMSMPMPVDGLLMALTLWQWPGCWWRWQRWLRWLGSGFSNCSHWHCRSADPSHWPIMLLWKPVIIPRNLVVNYFSCLWQKYFILLAYICYIQNHMLVNLCARFCFARTHALTHAPSDTPWCGATDVGM